MEDGAEARPGPSSNNPSGNDESDLITWEDVPPIQPAKSKKVRKHRDYTVAVSSRGRGCPKREPVIERQIGESEQQWESRLAVEELERYFKSEHPRTSREKERLKDEQVKAIRAVSKDIMFYENYVSRAKTPSPERPITPPGPPIRREMEQSLEIASIELGNQTLPIITRGVMFGNLKPIPTDPKVDPPPGSCISCWEMGHRRSKCPNPHYGYCCNCGRRGVTMTECPRCSEQHALDMMRKYGKTNYSDYRSERMEKVRKRMADSGKLSVQEKLRRDAEQGTSAKPSIKEQHKEVAELKVITMSKRNTSGVGRGFRKLESVGLERPGQRTQEENNNDEKRESTEKEDLDPDEIWALLEQVPTVTLTPTNLPVDQSTLLPNWNFPPPLPSPPVVYHSLPTLTLPQSPQMLPEQLAQQDDTDRFIEQTRSFAQALVGLPADAITLAMREFFEERRRVIEKRNSRG
ncbi:uncharacterized protein LOC122509726 [Leptopilina heterotoma]|uniref:uncharacterized protein LOC122509726 n=1 Tax=Leptopilina heterotoma TaxID=63436 RepID=UPI001CA8FC8B|nr:uncharacterized protein LOC122509726 [Leptopilina heterotoma]XP_043479893.1 uncharacterized protein LOC122509726 [Leptopilina heterotoma]